MNRWFSILLAAYVAVHAALGCCWHHAHVASGAACDHKSVGHDGATTEVGADHRHHGCHQPSVHQQGSVQHEPCNGEQHIAQPSVPAPPSPCEADPCEFVMAQPRLTQSFDVPSVQEGALLHADGVSHGLALSALWDRAYRAEHDAAGPMRAHLRLGVLLI